jgi:hypothetical protein
LIDELCLVTEDRGKEFGTLALELIEQAALGAGIIALHLEVSRDDLLGSTERFNPQPWPNRHYCDARKARPFASCKMAILALAGLLSRFCLAISARGLILEAKAARPSVNAWS